MRYKEGMTTYATTIAYAIGVPQTEITEAYESLQKSTALLVLRKLCSLRSAILLNYSEISPAVNTGTKLEEIQKISRICEDLKKAGIAVETKQDLPDTLVAINNMIDDRTDAALSVHKWLFPKTKADLFKPVKSLFTMPSGNTADGVKAGVDKYRRFLNEYPYQKYINWNFVVSGDAKLLLENNDKFFEGLMKVCEPSIMTVMLDEFLSSARKTALIVDCENSDPIKLFVAADKIQSRICKVVLIDDAHTTPLWEWAETHLHEVGVETERVEVERLKEHKSLVDLSMATRTMKEYYENKFDSFLLATSDSDIWALISSLPDARFMILPEESKCGDALINALSQKNICAVYLEDITDGEEVQILDEIICNEAANAALKWLFDGKKAVYAAIQQLMVTMNKTDVARCANKLIDGLTAIKKDSSITLARQ